MIVFWQWCFCSWLCFVICELLHLFTSHEVTGAKLRCLHVPRHQNQPLIIHFAMAHGSYLWISELMGCSYTTSLPINWSSPPAPPQVCSPQETPWRQMDFWLLLYFTLGLLHHLLYLFNPQNDNQPFWISLVLRFGSPWTQFQSFFLKLHCSLGSIFQSDLIFPSQNPLTLCNLNNHLCIWLQMFIFYKLNFNYSKPGVFYGRCFIHVKR